MAIPPTERAGVLVGQELIIKKKGMIKLGKRYLNFKMIGGIAVIIAVIIIISILLINLNGNGASVDNTDASEEKTNENLVYIGSGENITDEEFFMYYNELFSDVCNINYIENDLKADLEIAMKVSEYWKMRVEKFYNIPTSKADNEIIVLYHDFILYQKHKGDFKC